MILDGTIRSDNLVGFEELVSAIETNDHHHDRRHDLRFVPCYCHHDCYTTSIGVSVVFLFSDKDGRGRGLATVGED